MWRKELKKEVQVFCSRVVPVWFWLHMLKQVRYVCFCKLWLSTYFQRETDSYQCRTNQSCSPWKQFLKHKCDCPRWGGKKVTVCTKEGIVQIWKKQSHLLAMYFISPFSPFTFTSAPLEEITIKHTKYLLHFYPRANATTNALLSYTLMSRKPTLQLPYLTF